MTFVRIIYWKLLTYTLILDEFMGGHGAKPKKEVDTEKFYKLLEVDKNATTD